MNDDEMMDGILRSAMSGPPPVVSQTFVQEVQRRTAPRRLTRRGQALVYAYSVAATASCLWMMRDLPVGMTTVTLALLAGVAVALRSYTSHLTRVARP